jgi:hypothetical protein
MMHLVSNCPVKSQNDKRNDNLIKCENMYFMSAYGRVVEKIKKSIELNLQS